MHVGAVTAAYQPAEANMASPAGDIALHINSSGDGSAAGQPEQNGSTAQNSKPDDASSISRTSTQRSKPLTIYSANSIAHHYFGSQKNLEVLSEPSKMDDAVSTVQQAAAEAEVPPRAHVRTKLFINAIVLAVLAGVTGLSYYNNVSKILQMKLWYALITIVIIPIGMLFFAFAVNVAVSGVFTMFVGE
jgi:hypothetical protein